MGLYCGCIEGVSDTPLVRWFHQAWAKTGKKLSMGRSCIRFKKIEDLPLDVIGEAVRRMPARTCIEEYEKARRNTLAAQGREERPKKKPRK